MPRSSHSRNHGCTRRDPANFDSHPGLTFHFAAHGPFLLRRLYDCTASRSKEGSCVGDKLNGSKAHIGYCTAFELWWCVGDLRKFILDRRTFEPTALRSLK